MSPAPPVKTPTKKPVDAGKELETGHKAIVEDEWRIDDKGMHS